MGSTGAVRTRCSGPGTKTGVAQKNEPQAVWRVAICWAILPTTTRWNRTTCGTEVEDRRFLGFSEGRALDLSGPPRRSGPWWLTPPTPAPAPAPRPCSGHLHPEGSARTGWPLTDSSISHEAPASCARPRIRGGSAVPGSRVVGHRWSVLYCGPTSTPCSEVRMSTEAELADLLHLAWRHQAPGKELGRFQASGEHLPPALGSR
jgi:hypothetical protein